MELWLLSAGALVLIAITLWIVWPARAADAVATATPPQGDQFGDEYSSATAELSAGGAGAFHEEASAGPWRPTAIAAAGSPPDRRAEPSRRRSAPMLGLGAAALLACAGGAWLFRRSRQRQRSRPLYRFQNGARALRSRPRQPSMRGIGFGGLALIAGAGYVVWRLVR